MSNFEEFSFFSNSSQILARKITVLQTVIVIVALPQRRTASSPTLHPFERENVQGGRLCLLPARTGPAAASGGAKGQNVCTFQAFSAIFQAFSKHFSRFFAQFCPFFAIGRDSSLSALWASSRAPLGRQSCVWGAPTRL